MPWSSQAKTCTGGAVRCPANNCTPLPRGCRRWRFICATLRAAWIDLLTYAEGNALSDFQLQALKLESDAQAGTTAEILAELDGAISRSCERVRALASQDYSAPRTVGKKQLPTTLGGLLVHIADHTQRHVGQAITTAKLVSASNAL